MIHTKATKHGDTEVYRCPTPETCTLDYPHGGVLLGAVESVPPDFFQFSPDDPTELPAPGRSTLLTAVQDAADYERDTRDA